MSEWVFISFDERAFCTSVIRIEQKERKKCLDRAKWQIKCISVVVGASERAGENVCVYLFEIASTMICFIHIGWTGGSTAITRMKSWNAMTSWRKWFAEWTIYLTLECFYKGRDIDITEHTERNNGNTHTRTHRTLHFIFPFNSFFFSLLTLLYSLLSWVFVRSLVHPPACLPARARSSYFSLHTNTHSHSYTHRMNERERRSVFRLKPSLWHQHIR